MSDNKYSVDDLKFHPADYAVFIGSLLVSGGFGVYSGIRELKAKKERSSGKEAAMGARDLGVVPVAFSVMASMVAAPFVLGTPAEVYLFGTTFVYLGLGYTVGISITTHLLLSVFYRMGITSVYEYAEKRFSLALRRTMTVIFATSMLFYMGIIVYAPATALSSVTGISVELSVLVVGAIGTVYTSVGGLKGVIWVDCIQMVVIFAGFVAIVIKGTIDAGGADTVWDNSQEGGRIVFNSFSPIPTERTTFWTQVLGGAFASAAIFTNQVVVQKMMALPNINKMYLTAYVSIGLNVVYICLFVGTGLVIYAYYMGCDPLALQKFAPDQLVAVFTLRVFEEVPGVCGLVVAAIFAASLSSVAAGINALSAVTLLDLINPLCKKYGDRDVLKTKPTVSVIIFKLLAVFYGLLTIGLAFLAKLLGEGLLQLALSLLGIVGGPMLTVFIMGVFMPWMNKWGALTGLVMGVAMDFWVATGSIITGAGRRSMKFLPLTRDQCPIIPTNGSDISTVVPSTSLAGITGEMAEEPSYSPLESFYRMSYMWYTLFAVIVTLVVAIIISFLTGNNKNREVDRKLLHPIFSRDELRKSKENENVENEESPPSYSTAVSTSPGETNQGYRGNQTSHSYDVDNTENVVSFTNLAFVSEEQNSKL